ncbi:hypothetical protein FQA39_LY11141 [Lamprigera yunnana]|nr:hypothetical protein FQA39_LY11141 [Lamprigera yunnana]
MLGIPPQTPRNTGNRTGITLVGDAGKRGTKKDMQVGGRKLRNLYGNRVHGRRRREKQTGIEKRQVATDPREALAEQDSRTAEDGPERTQMEVVAGQNIQQKSTSGLTRRTPKTKTTRVRPKIMSDS